MKKLVSVIVPVYNVEKYLETCLNSILEQSYDNLELLLIDDGSTDQSGQICDYFAERDDRVQVIHIQNGGVSNARNIGLKNMNGEYCILVDSDDAIHKDTLSRAVQLLESDELDCVIYKYKTIDDAKFDTEIQEIQKCKSVRNYQVLDHENIMEEILIGKKFRMLACNKLYKTSLWKNLEYPIGRKYGDDTFVTYQLMDRCQKTGYLEEILYYYRMREGSALHQKVSLERLQLFDSYVELVEYYKENVPVLLEEAYVAFANRMFDFFPQVTKSALTKREKKKILIELRKRIHSFRMKLIFNSKLTAMQRILLGIFFCSINGFLCVYER